MQIIVNVIEPPVAFRGMGYPCNRQNLHKRLQKIKNDMLAKNIKRMVDAGREEDRRPATQTSTGLSSLGNEKTQDTSFVDKENNE